MAKWKDVNLTKKKKMGVTVKEHYLLKYMRYFKQLKTLVIMWTKTEIGKVSKDNIKSSATENPC
jgi:hypothetical protein